MNKITTILCIVAFVFSFQLNAQNSESFFKTMPAINKTTPEWAIEMYSDNPNVRKVDFDYSLFYKEHVFEKNIHTQNYKYWHRNIENLIDKNGFIDQGIAKKEYEILLRKKEKYQTRKDDRSSTWTSIGPVETYTLESQGGEAVSWQANVYCFDQSVSNPNILIAGTEAGGIYKSADKGLNWTMTSFAEPFTTVNDVKIAPSNENIIYANAAGHIFKSIDGCNTWTDVFDIGETGTQVLIHPTNPDTVFCTANNGFFRSFDGGQTWVSIIIGKCWDMCYHPTNYDTLYVIKHNMGIKKSEFHRSIDGGVTWNLITSGWYVPSSPVFANDAGARIAVTPAAPDMVYVGLIGESKENDNGWIGVYRSTDAGETWNNPNLPDGGPYNATTHANLATINLDGTGFHQGFFNFSLAVSHTDPGKLWIGCLALSVSTDSAATWTRIGSYNAGANDIGWIHPDIQDLHVLGNDTWVCCDGGINYSTDDLQTHESRKKGITASDFWGFGQGWNEDVRVGGRYHNGNAGYYHTYGSGNYLRLGGAEASTGYVNPLETRKAYFSDISTKTLPDSLTGDIISYGSLGLYPNESYFESYSSEIEFSPNYSSHMYLGKDNKIWKSVNEGGSFDVLYEFGSNDKVLEIEISRSNTNVMYCVLQPGGGYWNSCTLYKTIDAGLTWTHLPEVPMNRWRLEISLNPEDENELWVISVNGDNGFKVVQTLDGGNIWINKTSTALIDERPRDIIYQGGTDGVVYLATNTGFFYRDNSSFWTAYGDGLPLITRTLEVKPFYKDNLLRMATGGRGLWEVDMVEESMPIAQPMTRTDTVYCLRDTVQFDCYSILNHTGASWQWSFNPSPQYISSTTDRNPQVVFDTEGSYNVSLLVTDGSGNTSSKTVTNMVTVINNCGADTFPGFALNCSNTGDYAVTPNFNQTVDSFTITAWIKPDGIQPEYTGIVMSNGTSAGFNFRANNTLAYHWPGGAWWWNSNLIIPDNEWSHVALVVTPTAVTVYLNGIGATHTTNTDPVLLETFNIGSYKGWSSRNYTGQIDEVCMWDRALSQEEIRVLRHLTLENIAINDPTILVYYQFNEINGGILDRVGLNHATLTGGATREISTAPVGGGSSERMDINSSGIYSFSNEGVNIDFASGTIPGGEIVVTRINQTPDSVPNTYPGVGCYWIVNNYGTNNTFSALNEIQFTSSAGEVTAEVIADPSIALLFNRGENGYMQNWNQNCSANSATGGLSGNLSYVSTCGITNFSQFYITSNSNSVGVIGGIVTIQDEIENYKPVITIYPNPVKANMPVTFTYTGSENIRVKVISSTGKSVNDRILKNTKKYTIETTGLSSGIYLVFIEGDSFIETRKLIVN